MMPITKKLDTITMAEDRWLWAHPGDELVFEGRKAIITAVDREKQTVTFEYKDVYTLEPPNRRERRAAKARARCAEST